MIRIFLGTMLFLLLAACDISMENSSMEDLNKSLAKSSFTAAIQLLELHKIRNGEYPASLSELKYVGSFDKESLGFVRYERSGDGYNLYIHKTWSSNSELEFNSRFKNGLGLENSNVKWVD